MPSRLAPIVLDTHITLDLFVYADPLQVRWLGALQAGTLQWLATPAMRDELARVLDYPQIAKRRLANGQLAQDILAQMDEWAQFVAPAPTAPHACQDPDDQIFIDLAYHYQCPIASKDKAVLAACSRLKIESWQTPPAHTALPPNRPTKSQNHRANQSP